MSLTHKNAFSYDELISCAKGELFGPEIRNCLCRLC